MALLEMLKVANTFVTQTTNTITASADEIAVLDASQFPPGPNKFTLGVDNNAEVVRYAAISGNTFTGCLRGQDGTTSRAWDGGTDA